MPKLSIFTKIILIFFFTAILPLIFSNYFIINTYQDFINKYVSGTEAEQTKTQLEFFQKSAIGQGFIILFLNLLLVVTIFLILSKVIIGPIKRLVEGTKKITKGNFDAKVLIKTSDELEVLADSFNQMAEYLKVTFEKAKEERNKTLGVILNLVDGILVFDKNYCLRIINPQAEKIFKVNDYREVFGKSLQGLKEIPSFSSTIDLIGEKEIKQISKTEIYFSKNTASDKEAQVFEISTVPLIYQKEFFGCTVILHEVTREKYIEKLKSEFISLAAHQLRTPVSVVKWILESIIKGEKGELKEKQKDFLEKAHLNNEKMIAMVNDLLNVAKIEEGKFRGEFTEESLDELIKKAVQNYEELIKRRNIRLDLIFPSESLPKVRINKESIILAIKNLIENAIHYNLPGGKVTIEVNCDKMEIGIKIIDSGIGIPKHQQSRVFSKFFRGDNALKLGTSGTGLGLFIVKSIIQSHNGKIGFESEENKGSTFWFTLPV